jgi:para-nitrobenzyl esterase
MYTPSRRSLMSTRRLRLPLALMTALAVSATFVGPSAGLAAAMSPPVVTTTSGTFQGTAPDANGALSFKGVPYAAPPVGPLRWRSPQPFKALPGIRPAVSFGNACLAAPGPFANLPNTATVPQSEDCLNLNVWRPAASGAPRPVMVWLHGGGFQFGASADPTYDGSVLTSRGVVVVSLNYRLGVFGFLASSGLDAESGASGDWGLQDQLAGLRWVKQNIARFGGDPSQVTLFGESAGAHAVGLLMSSPKAKGLFSRAIIESGALWDTEHGSIATHAEALARGNQFVSQFAGQDPRSIPADVINARAPWDGVSDPTLTAFGPSVDGGVLTDSPGNVFRKKQQLHIPILGGWNGAEYFIFAGRSIPAAPPEVFYSAASNLFGPACLPEFKTLYPQTDATNAQAASFQLNGDMGISEQTWETLKSQAAVGPSYAYHFTYTSPYSPMPIHTAEVPFVFGTLTRELVAPTATPSDGDKRYSAMMMSYWTNFAKRGNPNGAGLPTWPTIGADGSHVLTLDNDPRATSNPDLARFKFLARYRQNGRLPQQWRALGSPYLGTYQGPGCP